MLGWWWVGFFNFLRLRRCLFFLRYTRHIGYAKFCPLHVLFPLRLVVGTLALRGLSGRHGSKSRRRGCRKRQAEYKLFFLPSPLSLRRYPQIQQRAVRDTYATAPYKTLSHRHHESTARCRRTKHSDVEGQETDQEPRCCQRVPSTVTAVSFCAVL